MAYWGVARGKSGSVGSRARKKNEEAIRLARSAADLEGATDKHAVTPGSIIQARELLGDLLIDLRQPAPALEEYEASLAVAPNRLHGLAGAARAARASGNRDKTLSYSAKLLALASRADADNAELAEARKSAALDK